VSSPAVQSLPRKRPTPSLATSPPKAKRTKTLKKGGIPGMFPHYSESTPLFSKPSNFLLRIVFPVFHKGPEDPSHRDSDIQVDDLSDIPLTSGNYTFFFLLDNL
jgi:hypothetical protein